MKTLSILKPQIISSLANQTYLSTLHKNLATIAESLTNLDSLYSYHPSTELSSNTKETIAIEVATWYTEYRTNHPSDCKLDERRELNYPLAVLLPVVIDIITTKNVTTIDSPPPPSPLEDPLHSITYPKWQGSYNNTFQDNTCPVDNILAILSLNRSTILNALSRKLNPNKCKSCGSTTAILERLSGKFESVPTLLTIEIGHLPELNKTKTKITLQPTLLHLKCIAGKATQLTTTGRDETQGLELNTNEFLANLLF